MKKLILILILTVQTMPTITAQQTKLIYIGDPMCSWCYGIAEELNETVSHFDSDVELELIMGGLRPGGGEEWNQKFKDFLQHHWEDVGIKSGQPFKFDLLKQDYFDYDTEPSCRSVVTVLDMNPDLALPFFKHVQKGFYLENNDPKQVDFYKPICEEMGLDFKIFKSKFESQEMKIATQNHFSRSQQMGVRSFPTVALQHKGQISLIASGYSTFDKMKTRIETLLKS